MVSIAPAGKTHSEKAREPTSAWMTRFKAHEDMWQEEEAERGLYRDAHENVYPMMVAGAKLIGIGAPSATQQTRLNVLEVYCRRLQAIVVDEYPEGRVPRRGLSPEMNLLADCVEDAVLDVSQKGGLPGEFRDAIPNICTDGGVGISVSMPA